MEIKICSDPKIRNLYTVTTSNNMTIRTTFAQQGAKQRHAWHSDDAVVKSWVHDIKKLHGKNKNETLVIGFSADSSVRYDNASRLFTPFEIFVICVDTYCLIYVPPANADQNGKHLKVSRALRKLFADKNAVVVGVGMENIADRVENKYGLKITKPMDLRKLAAFSKDRDLGSYGNHNLVRLGKAVLGEEWDLVKPKGIDLCKEEGRTLSDDKVKCVSVEALMANEMGKKLLQMIL